MSHTPGPWTAHRCEHGWHIGPQPDGVCTIHDNADGSRMAEHTANARLIAAAPDLLAACNVARVALEAAVGNAAQLDVAIEAIDAAVVKAVELAAVLAADRAKN